MVDGEIRLRPTYRAVGLAKAEAYVAAGSLPIPKLSARARQRVLHSLAKEEAQRRRQIRATAHRRQLKGSRSGSLLVVRENQSRRDLTKVAQYEVLG
jgi:hypothetical protein